MTPRTDAITGRKLRPSWLTLLLSLAVGGSGLGCVDTTPPWEKSDWSNRDSGTSPAPDAAEPVVPDAAGIHAETDEPVPPEPAPDPAMDAGEDQRLDRADSVDTQADTRPLDPDAQADAHEQPQDGGRDSATDTRRTDGLDALTAAVDVSPTRDRAADVTSDQGPDFDSVERDARSADLPPDVPTWPTDTSPEAILTQGLVAYYPCESANGSVLADQSESQQDATLANGSGGSTPAGFSFVPGKVGKGLSLSAQDKAFVRLPGSIASQLTQMTIATWVKLNTNTAFQRIFDLGVDTNTFMYLANSNGSGGVRFRIVSTPLNKNQVVEGPTAMSVGTWTHVTVTLGDDGISLFIDGSRVAQQAPAALRPSDLGDTGNNYIGRSQFASDPYLDGQIDEFRIYDRVLSAAEITDLASGR